MEALSSAASVIAVIQLAGSIAEICGGYISKVKDAKQDIFHLQQEVRRLIGILEELERLLRGPDGINLTTSQGLSVAQCLSTLTLLQKKIHPETKQNPMRRWGLRALKWPLQRKEVEKVINDIGGYKSLFSLALQVDQMKSTNLFDQKLDLGRLQTAKGAEFDSYENQHDECLPGTQIELLHKVEEWTTSPHGKCIFWLNGMAGTGKSTISRTIARRLKQKGLLGASFFFKRGEEDRGNAKKLFPTLIKQLVASIPQIIPNIQKSINEDANISEKVLREQFEKLLLQPLLGMKQGTTATMVIVIDALDECDHEDDIQVILQLLPQVQKSTSAQLRFLLTSRPELPIRLGFRGIINDYQDLILHKISRSVMEHDISLYFEHKFSCLRKERSFPSDWPGIERIRSLVERAVPLFISAATLYRFISDKRWSPEKRIQAILVDQTIYISKMDSTYMPVLNQLLTGQDKLETEQLIQSFKEIVGVIIILATPLSVNALIQLLHVEIDDVNPQLGLLHSVLDIPDSLDIPVRLLHLSFRDFLLQKRESNPFWIDEKEIHQNLTTQCLQVMQHSLRKNICNLSSDCIQRSEINLYSINKFLPPQLQYSCRYWAQHLVQSLNPVTELVQAFSVLKDHFLHWVEVMGILGIVSEVVGIIRRLQLVILDKEYPEISGFLYDAERYILKTRYIAHTAPLQIYSSGLIFAPTDSIIKRIFSKEIPSWLSQIPQVEKSWSAELQTLEGHSHWVRSVTFSPDGYLLASGSHDRTIKLWDATTGELCWTLKGHSDIVWSVSFSPDGYLLASGSFDRTIKLWDATTGELHQTLEGHSNGVGPVRFSPDGHLLASGSFDSTIKLWDVTTGELCQTLEGHSVLVWSVSFSPDGHLLASSSLSTINLWDATTGNLHRTLEGHSGQILSVDFSPDSHLLASASTDRTIKLWDATTGELHRTLEGHSHWVWSEVNVEVSILENQWICLQGEKKLWLPPDYRPTCLAMKDGIVALGHASGGVSLISRFT